ncbi:MAG: FAD-binding protein, partial [Actinomycetota bacterium]|nr:FAD-binding protein [Actinomycetota bacterium]
SSRRSWLDCRHLGAELLQHEFPTVVAGCKSFGLDPATDLLPLTPAAHYFIGGVQTDLDGRSSIPRLYAVGECSNTGAHGANRLAGNSLAEALVFGRRAARAIAGQRAGRLKSLPESPALLPEEVSLEAGWERIRTATSVALGIERGAPSLAAVASELEALAILPLGPDPAVMEMRAGAIITRLIARAALLRTESRGVHYRNDFPQPHPEWGGVRLRLVRS